MGNTATNVTTGKPNISGAVFVAPRTAQLPANAVDALPEGYVCLGYVSEDGLSNANEMDVSVIKAWGGVIVYRSLTELNDNFSLALIETENVDVLKSVYGDANVTVDASGNITVSVKAEDPQEKIWVFDLALRGNRAKRIVIQDGAVTAREEITYNDSDPVAYGITVSAYPDSSGETHKEYIEGEAHTVSFNSNGGTSVATQTVKAGGKAQAPTAPTKESSTFQGWYSDAALTTAYDFNTVVTENLILYAKWITMTNPNVAAEPGTSTLFETPVSDIQENVVVSGGKITGTLKYLDSGAIAGHWGAGNFLALKFTDIDSRATSVLVGMDPSESSGLVELINDPDKNGVFKVTNKDTQVFKVISTDGTISKTDTYDLSGLTLETEA